MIKETISLLHSIFIYIIVLSFYFNSVRKRSKDRQQVDP